MATTKNRSIKTHHDAQKEMLTLRLVTDAKIGDLDMEKGQTIEVTKSEARRMMSLRAGLFKIVID